MGKAEIAGITRKLRRQLAIAEPFVIFLAPPRTEMDLVDRHRRAERVDIGGRGTRMRQLGLVEYDRRGARAHFRGERHRIGLQRQMLALRADDIELIVVARPGAGHKQLPIADAAHAHRMSPRIPEIEIADHADPTRVGSQHHEGHSIDAVERHRMRAKLVVKLLMGTFAQQIKVEVASTRAESDRGRRDRPRCRRSGRASGSAWSRSAARRRTARRRECAKASPFRRARRSPRRSKPRAGMRARRSCGPRYEARDSERDRSGGLRRSHRPPQKVWS